MIDLSSSSKKPSSASQTYHLPRWSEQYFDINTLGEVCVNTEHHQVSMDHIINAAQALNLKLPILLRFPHILHHRVATLCQSFNAAIEQQEYNGTFTPVYPIKVNQQRRVVEEIIQGQLTACNKVGLEAGSKPELLAVMSEASKYSAPVNIVCNGYKDEEFIKLALMAEKLGHTVFIVIEKSSELELILKQSQQLNVKARIGIRARLSSIGKGNWQNTGGDKSKFGLTAQQILDIIEQLKAKNKLDCFQLLHFHLGSQIANIRDIQTGLKECGCFYTELHQLGVNIDTVDVGGGLGVDYEGTGSRSNCSINYSVDEYASNVVRAFREAAQAHSLPMPNLISESGRAVTAHHAVLISNVVDIEQKTNHLVTQVEENQPLLIQDLWSCWQALTQGKKSVIESYHEASYFFAEAKHDFSHSRLTLQQRALVDQLINQIYRAIQKKLDPSQRNHRDIIDELNEYLADKLFVNFSLFQSLPDVWGIDQLFPIMPLSQLNQPCQQRGIIQDMTCDSDGRIDQYVDGEGVESTLPLPPFNANNPWHLGFFMVGAYQEILGDMHNLFGDTDSVDVYINDTGKIDLKDDKSGDLMTDVLTYVDFNADNMKHGFNTKVQQSTLNDTDKSLFIESYQQAFDRTTYLG